MSEKRLIAEELDMDAVLCYVEHGEWAWFTTRPLDEQWGDDWNDRPYDCNAGRPYGPREGECWHVFRVGFDAPLESPWSRPGEPGLSVMEINSGAKPWLTSWQSEVAIYAGTTLARFIEHIQSLGGDVYVKLTKGGGNW